MASVTDSGKFKVSNASKVPTQWPGEKASQATLRRGVPDAPRRVDQRLARRADPEEALGLASVVGQSEEFEARPTKSLGTHTEMFRIEREQEAAEKVRKASTMIPIPTFHFIFPAVFVVLLAPAIHQANAMFAGDTPK